MVVDGLWLKMSGVASHDHQSSQLIEGWPACNHEPVSL
jgi:hypothetical protein